MVGFEVSIRNKRSVKHFSDEYVSKKIRHIAMAHTYLDRPSMILADFSLAEGKQGKIMSAAPAGTEGPRHHDVRTQLISTV